MGTVVLAVLQDPTTSPPDCFGHYSATAPECETCLAPLILQERIRLCRDVCKERKAGQPPPSALAHNLSSVQVRMRLTRGQDLDTILAEMVGPNPAPGLVQTGRTVLRRRLVYLAKQGFPVLDLDTLST